MESKLVSVVIPVFNCERYLGQAIESVLRQEHSNVEIIVVDDGSTDGSREVAKSFAGVRYLHQENRGIAAARNLGIGMARGELLTFLDADDLWTDRALALQLNALREHPEAHIVAGAVEQFHEPNCTKRGVSLSTVGDGYTPGAMLLSLKDFMRVGLFSEHLHLGDLMDWHSRAMNLGLVEYLHKSVVLRRRIHDTNTTLTQPEARKGYLQAIRAHLQRQRRAA